MAVQSTLQDSLKNEMHAPEEEGHHWSALQKATKTSRRYLAGFDALRFCAATMVMMYHLSFLDLGRFGSKPGSLPMGGTVYLVWLCSRRSFLHTVWLCNCL